MNQTKTISFTPLVCAVGVVAVVAMMPFFVSAASPDVLPAECPGTLSDYNVIEGTDGDDNLVGTDEPDYILGYDGNDVIDGAGGVDCIVAGGGQDEILHPADDYWFLGDAEEEEDTAEEDDSDADNTSIPSVDTGVFTAACVTTGNVVPVGRQLTFAAGHYGGEGEVTYRWLGAIEGEGQFQRPTFQTPGPKLITLVATDEDGRIATAGCPVLAQAGLTTPVYTPPAGGVGGAPGEAPTQQPPSQGGTSAPTTGADDEMETPDDTAEGAGVDITDQAGTNTGRIVLWVLIALIIISLGVLFWQRYYQDEGSGMKEKAEKKNAGKKPETKKDTDKKDSGSLGNGNDDSVIIPPAN